MLDPSVLQIRKSTIEGAGKGLFTTVFIPHGTVIIEYTGDVVTWKEVEDEYDNDYIYYVNAKVVINARHRPDSLGRYINDAEGFKRVKGRHNNCIFRKDGHRVYIHATKDIEARSELFVSYGHEYWEQGRTNAKLAAAATKRAASGTKK